MDRMEQIRPYRQGETDYLVALWQRAFYKAFPEHRSQFRLPWFYDQWFALDLTRAQVFVACVEHALGGFVVLQGNELRQLFVDPADWSHGIGTRLVGSVQQFSPKGLRLRCLSNNHRARQFYVRRGFVEGAEGWDAAFQGTSIEYRWPGRLEATAGRRPVS